MVFPIELPPLRERKEDIPGILSHLLRKHQKLASKGAASFDQDATDVLCRYDYPGNVRELENVVLRTMVSSRGGRIGVDALPPALVMRAMGLTAIQDAAESSSVDEIVPMEEVERRAILHAMTALSGNISLAARKLGLGRATLYRKMARYGITAGAGPEP